MSDKPKGHSTTEQDALRKQQHIDLAFLSQEINRKGPDARFYYEPMLAAHPAESWAPFTFLGKQMKAPLWISSMTGGTGQARHINQNLAKVCGELGLGMGLGSCRSLLDSDTYFEDFNLRPMIGDDAPFFANLGIAQIEQELANGSWQRVVDLVNRLQADGLIIHVNPLQEWLQPEGDCLKRNPLEVLQDFLEKTELKVIVKEVGQGMGPESLKALLQLPLAAIDFAAFGGTNFSRVELLRGDDEKKHIYDSIAAVGHSPDEMVDFTNKLLTELGEKALCREVIISGGIRSFLDGYYLMNKLQAPCIYGQGSAFLKHAQTGYDELLQYALEQVKGLTLAKAYLKVR